MDDLLLDHDISEYWGMESEDDSHSTTPSAISNSSTHASSSFHPKPKRFSSKIRHLSRKIKLSFITDAELAAPPSRPVEAPRTLAESYNVGDIAGLKETVDYICADDCLLRLNNETTGEASEMVGRRHVVDFHKKMLHIFPDSLIVVRRSLLVNGCVISKFIFTGTKMRTMRDMDSGRFAQSVINRNYPSEESDSDAGSVAVSSNLKMLSLSQATSNPAMSPQNISMMMKLAAFQSAGKVYKEFCKGHLEMVIDEHTKKFVEMSYTWNIFDVQAGEEDINMLA